MDNLDDCFAENQTFHALQVAPWRIIALKVMSKLDWGKKTGHNVFSLIPIRTNGSGLKAGLAWREQSGSTMKNCPMRQRRGRASLNCWPWHYCSWGNYRFFAPKRFAMCTGSCLIFTYGTLFCSTASPLSKHWSQFGLNLDRPHRFS